MMNTKREKKINSIRNGIIGTMILVIVSIIGLGIFYGGGSTQNGFVVGEDYSLIENPRRTRPGQPILVQEFFSYGCIHCRNLEKLIGSWTTNLPNQVVFSRAPVAFSPSWALLAQTYHTLEALDALEYNHDRIFRAIHDQNREFKSVEQIASFLAGRNMSANQFKDTFSSPEVVLASRKSEQRQRQFQITSVPTILVANKYLINMSKGRKRALEVADYLIDIEIRADSIN